MEQRYVKKIHKIPKNSVAHRRFGPTVPSSVPAISRGQYSGNVCELFNFQVTKKKARVKKFPDKFG